MGGGGLNSHFMSCIACRWRMFKLLNVGTMASSFLGVGSCIKLSIKSCICIYRKLSKWVFFLYVYFTLDTFPIFSGSFTPNQNQYKKIMALALYYHTKQLWCAHNNKKGCLIINYTYNRSKVGIGVKWLVIWKTLLKNEKYRS